MKKRTPVVGVLLGDHAGIGPEITVKVLQRGFSGEYIPLVIGWKKALVGAVEQFAPELLPLVTDADPQNPVLEDATRIYVVNLEPIEAFPIGKPSRASGQLMIDAIVKACDFRKRGIIDGVFLGPLTKESLQMANKDFSTEFAIFDRELGVKGSDCAVKAGNIIRSTVVGHFAFREIVERLNTEIVYENGIALYKLMKMFGLDQRGMAVAALNPHAGEDGLFGDEEARILAPAVERLQKDCDTTVIGPVPADTVYRRAQLGQIGGIVYLYHDQGNIAMKAANFSDAVVIFFNLPCLVCSPGHGSALARAGKGTADVGASFNTMTTLLEMIHYEMDHDGDSPSGE